MNGRLLIFQGTIFLFKKVSYIFRPNGHFTSIESCKAKQNDLQKVR